MLDPVVVTFLALGAGIGVVSGVSPGPVLTLVVTETLKGGWLRGAAVAAGPLLADGPIVVLSLLLVDHIPEQLVPALSFVGAIFLLYLAVTTALNARTAALPKQTTNARGGLVTGLLARALGPHPYLFWLLVGGPTLVQAQQHGWLAVVAFLVAYYATLVGSNVGLALVLHRWMGLLSERIYRGILLLASLILAAYGLLLFGRAISGEATR